MADAVPAIFPFGETGATKVTVSIAPREQWRQGVLRHVPFFVGRRLHLRVTMTKTGPGPLSPDPSMRTIRFLLHTGEGSRPYRVGDVVIPQSLGEEPVTISLDSLEMVPHAGQSNITATAAGAAEQVVYVLWGIMPESYLVPAAISLLVGLAIVVMSFVLRPSIVINLPPTP